MRAATDTISQIQLPVISTIKVVSLLPFKSIAFSENTCCLANTNPSNYVYNAMCKNPAPFASRNICISDRITERATAHSGSSIISSYHHSFPTHLGYLLVSPTNSTIFCQNTNKNAYLFNFVSLILC